MEIKYKANFRPSKAPGFMQCASYIWEPDRDYKLIESDEDMEFATLGIACHVVFTEYIVKKIKVTMEIVIEVAEEYNVAIEGYMGLARKSFLIEKKWKENLASFFTNPITEVRVGATLANGKVVQGTPDVSQVASDYGMIFDLKSGETDLDYLYQVMTYALLTYKAMGSNIKTWYLYVWSPVIDSYMGIEKTAQELEKFEVDLIHQFEKVGKEFKTGPWCSYCPGLTTCPAHRGAFLEMEEKVKVITVDNIAKIRPIIKSMEAIIKKYDTTEKALLTQYGTIPLGNGHELTYNSYQKDSLDVPVVVKELTESFNIKTSDIAPHLKMTKTALKGISDATAPPRGKTKRFKEIMEHLKENNAVTETTIKKRQVRRITEQLTQDN